MLKYFCGLSRDMNLLAGACFSKIATRLNVPAIKSLPPLIFNESCLNFSSEHFYHLQEHILLSTQSKMPFSSCISKPRVINKLDFEPCLPTSSSQFSSASFLPRGNKKLHHSLL